MAIKKCRECGESVSTEAKSCPKCGAAHPTETGMDRIISGFMTIVIAVIVGDFLFGWGLIFSWHRPIVPSPPFPRHTEVEPPKAAQILPSSPPPVTPQVTTPKPEYPVEKDIYSFGDLSDVLDIYARNQALFYSSVRGKKISATAPYKALSKSMFSDAEYSLLAGDRLFDDIRCKVTSEVATSRMSRLSKGDLVTIEGTISDVFVRTLTIDPCNVRM